MILLESDIWIRYSLTQQRLERGALSMNRFAISIIMTLLGVYSSCTPGHCGLDDLFQDLFDSMEGKQISNAMAIEGIQEIWTLSIERSIDQLSRENAFLDNPRYRINAPSHYHSHGSTQTGSLDDHLDILILKMNRIAEQIVLETRPILLSIIPDIPIINPQSIIQGQDDSASIYLKHHIRIRLLDALKPIVAAAMITFDVTRHDTILAAHHERIPGFSLELYFTDEFIDRLFLAMAHEEKSVRNHPESSDSPLMQVIWNHP